MIYNGKRVIRMVACYQGATRSGKVLLSYEGGGVERFTIYGIRERGRLSFRWFPADEPAGAGAAT